MLYTRQQVKENLRNRQGQRVFYLQKGDILTNDAKDYLQAEHIAVLPAEMAKPRQYTLLSGETMEQKIEHYTHLNGETLVPKTHPVIAFRGMVDTLEAELLWCMQYAPAYRQVLQQILDLTRRLIRCDVLQEPVGEVVLDGLDQAQQRHRSHFPQKYYGIAHFMPSAGDSPAILALNRVRCIARQAELAAVRAFAPEETNLSRPDILQAMNRISSMLYILMLQEKGKNHKSPNP